MSDEKKDQDSFGKQQPNSQDKSESQPAKPPPTSQPPTPKTEGRNQSTETGPTKTQTKRRTKAQPNTEKKTSNSAELGDLTNLGAPASRKFGPVPEEAIERMVALKRMGYSYRQIQQYFVEKTGDEYSTETLHRWVTRRLLDEDGDLPEGLTRPRGSSPDGPDDRDTREEREAETPVNPQTLIINETLKLWGITPDTYFLLAAEAHIRGFPNVGAFVIQKCLPWVKFQDELERQMGRQITPKGLLASLADWGRQLGELGDLKQKLKDLSGGSVDKSTETSST